jgi:hypothetical protein
MIGNVGEFILYSNGHECDPSFVGAFTLREVLNKRKREDRNRINETTEKGLGILPH